MTEKRNLIFWVGLGISCLFMVLFFRKIDFPHLSSTLASADYRYVLAAIASTFFSYYLRAVRWRLLLLPVKDIPVSVLYPATIVGYMANNLLPARLGEVVRAFLLAGRTGLETPTVLASLVIDRLFDGFTVILLLVTTMLSLRLPSGMADTQTVLRSGGMIMFLLYAALVVFMVFLKRQTVRTLALVSFLLKPFPSWMGNRIIPLLGSFIGGIRISGRLTHLFALLLLSFLIWGFALWPIDLILRAFGFQLPLSASMFILVLLVFAVMVPASPGYIGTYHYACFQGLNAFLVPQQTSVSIALIIHGTSFFPVILAGFYHLWKEGIPLRTIRKAGTPS